MKTGFRAMVVLLLAAAATVSAAVATAGEAAAGPSGHAGVRSGSPDRTQPACCGRETAAQQGVSGKAVAPGTPTYRIYPLRNGVCKIAGNHAFHGGNREETYDYFDAFPNARLVVNRREFDDGKARPNPDVKRALAARPGALHLVEDEELVPGVRVFPLGCHTPASQGILAQTHVGPVVLTGDAVYKYENIEKDCPLLKHKGAPSCSHD